MRVGILDTNLFKLMTRPDKRHQYDQVITWLHQRGLIDFATSLIIVTPGGVMEFLGFGTLSFTLPQSYLDIQFEHIRRNPKNFSEISQAKKRIMLAFERELYKTGKISKKNLAKILRRELGYVDNTLKGFVSGLIKDNIHPSFNRKVLANRIAIDSLQRVQWPNDILTDVYTSLMVDVHHAMEYEISYNSTRSVWFTWVHFNRTTMMPGLRQALRDQREGKEQPIPGHLPLEQQIENLEKLEDLARFKPNDDFVDTEAIHYAVVGRFQEGELGSVLYSTCDPINAVLTRLMIFKWFYIVSYQMTQNNYTIFPPMSQGKIVCFELRSLTAKFLVDVSVIPHNMDFLSSRTLDSWLVEMKGTFAV